jgi:hypothetical protein
MPVAHPDAIPSNDCNNSGDLDQYNGRLTVTPQYPIGTYAYFLTIDSTGAPAFPYVLGLQYCGTVSGSSVNAFYRSH